MNCAKLVVDLGLNPGLGDCRAHDLTTSGSLSWPYFVLERFMVAAQCMQMPMSILWPNWTWNLKMDMNICYERWDGVPQGVWGFNLMGGSSGILQVCRYFLLDEETAREPRWG